jgi:hypothetical protein
MSLRRSAALFRVGAALILTVAFALSAAAGRSAIAQEWSAPTTVYVDDAGHTVDGLFLDFWRIHQDLLGDPITEEFTQSELGPTLPDDPPKDDDDRAAEEDEDEIIVQFFENGAIAYLPENPPGEQVEMVPIGETAADAIDREYRRAFRSVDDCGTSTSDCVYVEETDQTVRHGFLDFGENGDAHILLGNPISEEFVGEDDVTFQYFEFGILSWTKEADVEIHPAGEDVADLLELDTDRIEPPDGLPSYDEALFIAPEPVIAVGADSGTGPGPQQGAWKEIVISLSAQTLWAYENDELVISTLVSTGTAETVAVETPLGYYQVLTKYDVQTMEGTISDEYYRVEDVPDVMYFDNLGNAIHGAYWHNNFGTPMSHGCVNAPLDIAAFLYDWAPIGTAVSVIP